MPQAQRVRRSVGVALAIVYSLALFLIVGEVATRALGLLDRLTGSSRDLYVATDLPDLPYRLNPGVTIDAGGSAVHINGFGLRGREIAAQPVAGVERILVIGDSIIYGQGVADDETFPVQLQRELRDRGRRVEVLNGGVPGCNNAAELAFLRAYGLALHPRRVVLGISLNDFGETPVISQAGILTTDVSRRMDPDRWMPVSEFWVLLQWTAKYAGSSHWYQGGGRGAGQDMKEVAGKLISYRHRRYYEKPQRSSWQRVTSAMRGIRDLCSERALPLLVVIFPESYQKGAADTQPQERWMTLCSELDIECIDLWPAFDAAGGNLYLGTQHHTPAGLGVAARVVGDALVEG